MSMGKEAAILKIQRFAINDGYGIRTTVFFKGCPLSCKWCHNPETMSARQQLALSHKLCVNCGRCVEVCRNDVHSIENSEHFVDYEKCVNCGKCVEACPVSALSLLGQKMSLEEIMSVVRKDIDYYKESGGGLTASGGEPLFQDEFVRQLFEMAHKEGISTTLDSSCYASPSVFDRVLEHTDCILFDLKIMDPSLHQFYVGVTNDVILRNFRMAMAKKKTVIVRRIVVPSVNDSEDELQRLADFLSDSGFSGEIDLLPYHRMATIKYKDLGKEYLLDGLRVPEDAEMQNIKTFFEERGFNCKIK